MLNSFLLDQGVEMELDAEMKEVIDALDKAVSGFQTEDYTFKLSVTKGVLGSQWRFLVNAIGVRTKKEVKAPLGFVTVSKEENGKTSFKIPPKSEWGDDPLDTDGRLFTNFIFRVFETFHLQGWIELAGPLPQF
jgi:hypothetical protein